MRYILPIFLSLGVFILPFIDNKTFSWEIIIIILGYLWIGVAIGEDIEKHKDR